MSSQKLNQRNSVKQVSPQAGCSALASDPVKATKPGGVEPPEPSNWTYPGLWGNSNWGRSSAARVEGPKEHRVCVGEPPKNNAKKRRSKNSIRDLEQICGEPKKKQKQSIRDLGQIRCPPSSPQDGQALTRQTLRYFPSWQPIGSSSTTSPLDRKAVLCRATQVGRPSVALIGPRNRR